MHARGRNKGCQAHARALRRGQAIMRNAETPYDRRASYRRQVDQLTGLDENPQPAPKQKRRRRKPKVASA